MLRQVWMIDASDLALIGSKQGIDWIVAIAALKQEVLSGPGSSMVFKNSVHQFHIECLRVIFKHLFDENPEVDVITVMNNLEF